MSGANFGRSESNVSLACHAVYILKKSGMLYRLPLDKVVILDL